MAEPKKRSAPKGKVRTQYLELELPPGASFELDYVGKPPDITVLGVDRVEGSGMGQFVNRWRYTLTWHD